jgi:hypothetical protein
MTLAEKIIAHSRSDIPAYYFFYGVKIPGEPNPANGAMTASFFQNSNSA